MPDLNGLRRFDRALLSAVQIIVPIDARSEWLRTWHAEIWHMRHLKAHRLNGLSVGLTRDALWLRTDSWRRAYTGAVSLCLATLAILCAVATLIMVILTGSWPDAAIYLGIRLPHFMAGSPLLVVVYAQFTKSNPRHTEHGSASKFRFWFKRKILSSRAHHAGARGPSVAQLARMEWKRTPLPRRPRPPQRPGNGNQLVPIQPMDIPDTDRP